MIKSGDSTTLSLLRSGLLLVFAVGCVGVGIELFLIGHTEELWQWVPLALMGASLVVVIWHVFSDGPSALRVFRVFMALFVASALVGIFLHYSGNAEFEREMYPNLGGFKLFTESVTGATPALAPGTMLHLGLIGFLFTLRHPRFRPAPAEPTPTPHRVS